MAGLTEQKMYCAKTGPCKVLFRHTKAKCSGSAAFWAWVASIVLHLIVLTTFGVIKFSQSKAQDKQKPIPTTKVTQIRNLTQTAQVIPKPKIKKTTRNQLTKSTSRLLTTNLFFDNAKPCSRDSGYFIKASTSQIVSLSNSANLPVRVEFFGSWTEERKICYLVDCSGSMQGMFSRVRRKLAESIKSLQPDQYFYIIFFGDDKLSELGKGQLLRATEKAKSDALDFIQCIRPVGQTNALAALERAVQVRDGRGAGPSVIYFLTDGFELTTEDMQEFLHNIKTLLRQFAPETRINTIGFWPQGNDRKMLKTIAKQTGGEFVIIAD